MAPFCEQIVACTWAGTSIGAAWGPTARTSVVVPGTQVSA